MKIVILFLVMGLALCGLSQVVIAQGEPDSTQKIEMRETTRLPGEKPGVVMNELRHEKMVVLAIDYEKRTATLKDADGDEVEIKAGPEVRNFAQVKVGDEVVVDYYEQVALYVRPSMEKPTADAAAVIARAPLGASPAGAGLATFEVTARVEAVDYGKRTIKLKGPAGNTRKLKVSDEVKRFNEIKVGDEVVLNVLQGLAIAVKTPDVKAEAPEKAKP